MAFDTIDSLEVALREADYLPDRGLATALYLSLRLEKPLLLEGEAGVGKTEAAKALARALAARDCSGCSATRASTSPTPSTSGTTRASSCTSAPRRRGRSTRRSCSGRSS